MTGAVLVLGLLAGAGACGGGDSSGSAYEEPKGPAIADLSFEAENFAFDPKDTSAPPGVIGITLESTEGGHDFVIEGVPGFDLDTPGTGDTDVGKVRLKPDEYTFYCTLPGHRAAGMEGTLTVG